MTQADRVHSTPPLNTPIDTYRRRFLTVAAAASAGSVGTLAVAAMPSAAAPAGDVDAELIAFGRQFEILVDAYYATRAVWAPALRAAHVESDALIDEADRATPH